MPNLSRRLFLATPAAGLFAQSGTPSPAPAPLFRDPIYDGAFGGTGHEGPNVFRWRGAWWMITDHWDGLVVFRSTDALAWTRQAKNILREPGKRPDDGVKGGHADILVQGEDAWVLYFTHPGRVPGAPPALRTVHDVEPYALRRTSIQVAKLELEGSEVVCRRDEPFPFRLQPAVDNWTAVA